MAKRKKRRRSYGRRARRYFRRAKPKIPLEIAVAGMAIPFVKSHPNNSQTPMQAVQRGDFEYVMRSLMEGFTPMNWYGNEFNVMEYLNPFSPKRGIYMKMLLYAGLASKIRKKVVRIPFKKIPVIGSYIS